MLVTDHEKVCQSGVLNIGISDHLITYCTRMAKYRQHCPGFKQTTVGNVLLDLVSSTGDIIMSTS